MPLRTTNRSTLPQVEVLATGDARVRRRHEGLPLAAVGPHGLDEAATVVRVGGEGDGVVRREERCTIGVEQVHSQWRVQGRDVARRIQGVELLQRGQYARNGRGRGGGGHGRSVGGQRVDERLCGTLDVEQRRPRGLGSCGSTPRDHGVDEGRDEGVVGRTTMLPEEVREAHVHETCRPLQPRHREVPLRPGPCRCRRVCRSRLDRVGVDDAQRAGRPAARLRRRPRRGGCSPTPPPPARRG